MPLSSSSDRSDALVTVIVPTHSHDETLEHSVRSILAQTVADLRVVIVGDGATESVRDVARRLCRLDDRVRFDDHPKTGRRGEVLRDRVIRASTAKFIAYNCDDDLWLADHLETLLAHIGDCDFIHPLPILIGADGIPFFMPSDLRRRDSVQWHLGVIPRNTISLSGVMHTRESYLRLPHGWRDTPEGRWTDHYMWQQFFEQDWFAGVTSPRSTTLKLTAQGRDDLPAGERRRDIESWWNRMHEPGFVAEWEAMVRDAMWRSAVDHSLASTKRTDEAAHMHFQLGQTRTALEQCEAQRAETSSRLARVREELRLTRRTLSWRITRPLRAVRRLRGG